MNKFYTLKKPSIEGFDTETRHGNLLLITSSENYKEPKSFIEAINFLWYNAKDLNFFYNIGFDFSVIVKMYLYEHMDKMEIVSKTKSLAIGDYFISFISNKGFSIFKGNRHKRFFDISQFYSDGYHRTLEDVSQSVLGIGKSDKQLDIDRKAIGEIEGYYEKHREKIIEYGMKDSLLTKRLGEIKVDEVYKFLGVYPTYWFSSASISKAYLELKHKGEKWQYWLLINNNKLLHFYIYQSYFGGIFLNRILGYVANATEIDINSAYPYAINSLYSINGAKVKEVKKPNPDCDYGFYKIKVKFNGLIPYRTKFNIIYPESMRKIITFMTAIEYNYWKNKTDIEFISGYEIETNKVKAFPEFSDIYQERQKIKKDKSLSAQMRQWNLKTIMNATYGVFAQSKGGYTYWTNFIYASYITAITRLLIYKAIEHIGFDNVIAILTDSIIFRNYNWDFPDSNVLGDFKKEFSDNELISYMSGLYSYSDEISNEYTDYFTLPYRELKKRGFPNLKPYDLRGNTNNLKTHRTKVRKLLESIIQHKIETIGDFFPEEKSINLLSNLQKYDFPEDKLNYDYLNSKALIGKPILVNNNQSFKEIDWKAYRNITKGLYRYKKYIQKVK